jgi:hypothetical protein
MRRRGRCALAVALVLAAAQMGCTRPSWLKMPDMPEMPTISMPSFGGKSDEPARSSEVEVVNSSEVTDFYTRASEFYRRLEGRRFNSIASFRDAGLREYFGTDQSFVDYYATLADELSTASFERSVPLHTDVQEFLVDAPGRARVKVRIVGEDGRPLRFWATSVEREDRWERRDGRWWILPGRS